MDRENGPGTAVAIIGLLVVGVIVGAIFLLGGCDGLGQGSQSSPVVNNNTVIVPPATNGYDMVIALGGLSAVGGLTGMYFLMFVAGGAILALFLSIVKSVLGR